ncbi:hypothetical protein [Methylocystis sp.]|jgi:hypothetical protein|uniref:hypothetical protein n=1 Tax=Methylocystis sp. TaxID=1911079 RepID=UPI003DA43DD8
MPTTTEQIHAGQAVYTPNMLAIYDVLVLGLSNRWIWKCPTPRLLATSSARSASKRSAAPRCFRRR